jgi:uncharacterized coiled-coil DUF342 family protein
VSVTPADDYHAVTARLLQQTTDELRRERDAMRAELHAARAELDMARARIALLESVLRGTEDHLAALQSGLGWAVLKRFRDMKARILAPGSPVERAYGRLTGRVARRLDGS